MPAAARTCSATRCSRTCRQANTPFVGIAAHRVFGANLAYKGQTATGDGMLVSGSYFPLLGLRPALGRLLGPDDDLKIGESRVVVLSYTYWQTRFGLSPSRPQRHDHRQRPEPDDRRRGAHGLRRDDDRRPATRLRADHAARDDGSWLRRVQRAADVLGVPVRAAEARHHRRAGEDRGQRPLSPDRQRGRGAAAEGHERRHDEALPREGPGRRARRARPELGHAGGQGAR